ncbi:hypothetical protein DBB29_24815 [Pandoraea cepalis]|uniref:I-spanin n=1 Tax=Pandoraea cepalis TaxID=2508294 RepID=A0AAW7MGJ6_9BURK|nr:hypothetical protein [Pandoraea cepalis]MDN4571884.1 hypothetical protein [Pandoraea cepalis]MDN4581338.1 hypothetical protein [Pandoraea cepalis]
MSKLKIILKRSALAVGLLALLGTAGWSAVLQSDNTRLKRENKEQSGKLATQKQQIFDLTKSKSDADGAVKQLKDAMLPVQQENQTLKVNIGAFATQAASCEMLKKKLNYKG